MKALERKQSLATTRETISDKSIQDNISQFTEEDAHQLTRSPHHPEQAPLPQNTQVQGRKRSSMGNNIMKNYCRAFVNFALSDLANPYLAHRSQESTLSTQRFRQILENKKKKVNCIKSLRGLLLHDKKESKEMEAFKEEFQKLCEVFLKYFCVNWIFHSKVSDRIKHLQYRGKMLRRIQNPEFFTYLEEFGKRKLSAQSQS